MPGMPQVLDPHLAHVQAESKFRALTALAQRGNAGMQMMGGLAALGQQVTRKDVFQHTMDLMAQGHGDAKSVAKEFASMPPDGPGLAEWIQDNYRKMQDAMKQVAAAQEQAREAMGTTAQSALLHMVAKGRPPATVAAAGAAAPIMAQPSPTAPQPQGGLNAT
jgi:hypothetical protein